MRASDFSYDLPQDRIAQYPAPTRRESRLLVLDPDTGEVGDRRFLDLPLLLAPGDLLVLNDTRVINARLHGHKESGGRVEVLVERVLDDGSLLAHVRASHAPRPGSALTFAGGERARVRARRDDLFELELANGTSADALLSGAGAVPLPPYIRRAPESLDHERYQTVYARVDGSVAAPTAGLHFDEDMLAALRAQGVVTATITLHVGAGTFQPLRDERVESHVMHPERVIVPSEVCARVRETRARGARVVAVGTTCVRALETAAAGGDIAPFAGETRLFIRPGHRFHCVDALLTNFHLPESTLLMLVCAFAGRERVLAAYRHAVQAGYRFYSYGDAMFIPGRGR